jgi:hypothetical protein
MEEPRTPIKVEKKQKETKKFTHTAEGILMKADTSWTRPI